RKGRQVFDCASPLALWRWRRLLDRRRARCLPYWCWLWKSGRGLPQSKTLRDHGRTGRADRFRTAPVLWRFGDGAACWTDDGRDASRIGAGCGKAVEGYRSPRRFATTDAQEGPTGFGLRQSSGALAMAPLVGPTTGEMPPVL